MAAGQGGRDGLGGGLLAQHGRCPFYYCVFSLAPLLLIVISTAIRIALLLVGATSVFGAMVAALGKLRTGAFGEWALLAQFFNLVVGFVMATGGRFLIGM